MWLTLKVTAQKPLPLNNVITSDILGDSYDNKSYFDHVLHAAVFSKISHFKRSKRWRTACLLRSCANKLVLFICLESVLAGLIFGTGYIAVLS